MCLSRLIQNAPPEVLVDYLEAISEKLRTYLTSAHCKAKTQVLEALISLLVAVEIHFEPHAVEFLPQLLDGMSSQDWSTRKTAIDTIFTISQIIPDVLIQFKTEINEVLNQARFDKYKPVREAAVEAFTALKGLGGDSEKKKRPMSVREQMKKHKAAFKASGD
jgi:hypothetical protein